MLKSEEKQRIIEDFKLHETYRFAGGAVQYLQSE